MIIKTWRDPYDSGFSTTKPKEIELKTGLTVLVGCNGAGKSTLINNIKSHCKQNRIPCIAYNNLSDGGNSSIADMIEGGQFNDLGGLICASEGEAIKENLGRFSSYFLHFFENGYINDRTSRIFRAFADTEKLAKEDSDNKNSLDRVLLFDAVDSGLSVDSVIEVKAMFEQMIEDSKSFKKNIYIIIAANEYELARNVDCFDVNDGKYLTFADYEDYRNFIIKSRQNKEKRIKKQKVWYKKQHDKELAAYIALKEKNTIKIQAILDKYNGQRPTWTDNYSDRRKLDDLEREIKSFVRNARFLFEDEIE